MNEKMLLIDDHIMISEGIKSVLSLTDLNYEIECVESLEKAYKLLFENKDKTLYDLVSVDLSMPPYEIKNINCGKDLAYLIRKNLPNTKILILTGYCDSITLNQLLENVNPNGFIEKSDLKAEQIEYIFEQILNGVYFKSNQISILHDNYKITTKNFDNLDIQIIKLLSKGFSTKSLPEKLPLSLSAIKKRKQKIKVELNIEYGNDENLIKEAIKLKII